MPAIRFQTGLAGASGANAAALTGKGTAHARQPGQQVLILRQLHLKPPFSGLGPLGKDVENQGRPVNYCGSGHVLQRTDL